MIRRCFDILFYLLYQALRGQDPCVQCILQGPAAHGCEIHPCANADFLLRFVKEGDFSAKPVHNVIEQIPFCAEGDNSTFPCEHI